ncbi:MAG: TIM barrel protein, partial [Planctomycetota bacterium]
MQSGLVSITFRQLDRAAVVDVARQAGLAGIEWGGDVHVPPGDVEAASDAARRTADAGLNVASYGSYFRCTPGEAFEPVLETAVALGAPVIRVWAGDIGSANADADAIAETCHNITAAAASEHIVVAAEWHGGTLTDTLDTGVALARAVNHPNFKLYWQPARHRTFEQRRAELEAVLPWLAHVHVFQWRDVDDGPADRRPLAEGDADWR